MSDTPDNCCSTALSFAESTVVSKLVRNSFRSILLILGVISSYSHDCNMNLPQDELFGRIPSSGSSAIVQV